MSFAITNYLKYVYIKTFKRNTIANVCDYKALRKGSDWNPLLKYPRNEKCFCGSGKKFKQCCLNATHLAVEKDLADQAKVLVDKIRGK